VPKSKKERDAAAILGKKRWRGTSAEERSEFMRQASRIYWDSLGPEERSRIMKERAAKRDKRK
jgi:hypothetical protein